MISIAQAQDLLRTGNAVLVGQDGSEIGRVRQIFLADETSQPEWITIETVMFGGAECFVPLQDATVQGDRVTVPFDEDTVTGAPRVDDSEGHLSRDQIARLSGYYAMTYVESAADSAPTTPGPHHDGAMTRSEERLVVGTEQVRAGSARLRRFVVTEQVTRTVSLSHDEVWIEREPILDTGIGDARAELGSEEHEVVLTAERVVLDTRVVPVERVWLGTESVTEQRTVTEDVRREHIEIDGDIAEVAEVADPD